MDYIANHLYSNLYGTFLFNNDKERESVKLKRNTVSIWTKAFQMKEFKNHFFRPKSSILVINCDPRALNLWPYYYRWDPRFLPKETVAGRARDMLNREKLENEHIINTLKEELRKAQGNVETTQTPDKDNKEDDFMAKESNVPSETRWERSETTLGRAAPGAAIYAPPPPPDRGPQADPQAITR